ncbi:tyrosine-type recombinase/integrase [Hymenobacter puniceus]|uniref:tyrosine-type recombinase/integrase n=1 Tax=Hymenobacter sp. BT190 TaxID=2763505 RepID=UPI001650EB4C|nr:site-specific integrase [Hymenobacter sp. BT190]MBC6698101.1 site-specific integrase [Hymenobacter sp. BT190]
MQIIIRRTVVPIKLGITWFAELFDKGRGMCLTSLPKAKRPAGYEQVLQTAVTWAGGTPELLAARAEAYNLIIGQARARANEIFVDYHLSKRNLTRDEFLYSYSTAGSSNDFVAWMERKIIERHRRRKIQDGTRKNHFSTLNELKRFRKVIPFYELTTQLVEAFHEHLVRHVRSVNTRWTRHRDVKAYLNLARKEKIKFEDPYADFVNQAGEGSWKSVPPAELLRLERYYLQLQPGTAERRVLQRFLFSCFSSLRLGDLKAIQHAKLDGQELTFRIQKTYAKKLRETMLPLTRRALRYLLDAQEENGGAGFFNYTDQYSNRMLKRIAQHLELTAKLHHHIGRETFATEFTRAGGPVQVLQKLMDHSKITTTMKYVHVDDAMKRDAIAALDAQLPERPMNVVV